MAFIKKSFITERLLPNVPIEKVIGQYVTLKKSGANYMGCCPFHHEKTPSFSVTPAKQMYYCFGCKEHGNVIDFIMKYRNLGFVEAIEEIAQNAGVEIEYEEGSHSKEEYSIQKEYYDLMDKCATLFSTELRSQSGAAGLDYFVNKRSLSEETIVKSRLGFAPADPNFLQKKLCKSSADIQKLVDLGMLVRNDYGVHSMYRNRVMIPIFDRRGRIISFGGRTMGDDKPKYLNTKETPIYKKRNELFGLYETLKANNNRPQRIVVVEGYMDVISVRQAGCSYAVASLGTATTPEQIKEMFRYTDKVVCCYDGDSAGRKAAWHALETVTPVMQDGKEIRFAFLPAEHDPDSLVREQGLSAFTGYLDDALSYPEFLILHNSQMFDLKDPNGLSSFIADTIKKIKAIPLEPLQSVSLKLLSKPSGISETQLYDMLKNASSEPASSRVSDRILSETSKEDSSSSNDKLKTPMRRLMAFIIQQPTVVLNVYHEFALENFMHLCEKLQVKGVNELRGLLRIVLENKDMSPAKFIELTRDSEFERVVRVLMKAPLNTAFESGSEVKELSMIDRIEYFADILAAVIVKPLKERAAMLKVQLSQNNLNAMAEHTELQKQIISINKLDEKK
ncbi:MAG: DNA primase [Succinivibrio sp.]